MKNFKRIISAVLTIILALSLVSTSAFAGESNNVKQYKSYLAIGSSITRGCGLDSYEQFDDTTTNVINGNYPDTVAKAVGLESNYSIKKEGGKWVGQNRDENYDNRHLYTFQGLTITSLVSVMGLTEEDIDPFITDADMPYVKNYYKNQKLLFAEGCTYLTSTGTRKSNYICDLLSSCELITIELGMGDVVYRAKEMANLFGGKGSDDGIVAKLSTLIKEMYVGYDNISTYYPMLLDFIKERNPNATVVLVGTYNMVGGLTLTEESFAPFGDTFESIFTNQNKLFQTLAKEYDYLYADISDTETPTMQGSGALLAEDFKGDMNAAVHPATNEGGLGYIARQIINVLPEETVTEKNKYDIKVDLGSISSVSSVKVNGITLKETEYELNGNVLTIHRTNGLASSLSTVTVAEDGKVTTRTYRLTYSANDGYTAKKSYGINDYLKKMNLIPNKIKEFFASLFSPKND